MVLSANNVRKPGSLRSTQDSVHSQKRRLWRGSNQEEGMWGCKGNHRTRCRVWRRGEATAGELDVCAALRAPPTPAQSTWALGTPEV